MCACAPAWAAEDLPLAPDHPRLVFRPAGSTGPGRRFAGVRALYEQDTFFRGVFDKALAAAATVRDPAWLAACGLSPEKTTTPAGPPNCSCRRPSAPASPAATRTSGPSPWPYDWLHGRPELSGGKRQAAVDRIAARLDSELAVLDKGWMAMWHGRNQAANGAMIAALAIGDLPGVRGDLLRAAAHYAEAIRALDFSEGWPEGASATARPKPLVPSRRACGGWRWNRWIAARRVDS